MQVIAQAHTDIGRKKRSNEDTFLIDPKSKLYIVADGMGGHAAGEVASATAVESTQRLIREGIADIELDESEETRQKLLTLLERAVRRAGRDIHAEADYRAHLIVELAKRAVAKSIAR